VALGVGLPDTTLVNVLVVVASTFFIWLGSGWLESSAERLSSYYGLPAVIQGSVVVAIGSSFPELASVVFTALSDVFDMGIGAIVGSAIFNILVIPAVSGILTDGYLDSNRTLVYKEAQFYMVAVSALIVTLALAVIYFPDDAADLVGTMNRPLAVAPILLYGVYVFIQWQDISDHDAEPETDLNVLRQWATLVAGLVVILVTVEQLVGAVESLTGTLGIPDFLAGVTIIAAATSLPDTLISVRAARDGRSVTSLGNVLGSNTFDLLVAIPIGILIAGSAPVNFAVAAPMMGVLTVATILLFMMLRTDLVLTTHESYLLLVTYLLFVAWMVAETVGILNFVVTG
jgi:cation:H+ antiporter